MPTKKAAKPKTRSSTTRERSKSVGRATPRSRSRTPTRSRSRSRVTASSKRSRTPASESKVRRRRSSSSSSSSPSPSLNSRNVLRSSRPMPDASGDKRTRSTISAKESTPSRFSQRIIHKIEANKHTPSLKSYSTPPSTGCCTAFCDKLAFIFREQICPSPIMAFFCIASFMPFLYWLNLLVHTPAPSHESGPEPKVHHTIWGPTYRFAGVLWPTDWRIYFDYRCHVFILLYYILSVLVARFIPIGRRISVYGDSRRLDYRCNGLFSLVLFCALFTMAQYCRWASPVMTRPSTLLPKFWFSLMAAASHISIIGSLVVFLACKRIPRSQAFMDGNTGNFFVDFLNGKSMRPRWFGVDWKMFTHRASAIALIFAELTYLCVQWERYGRLSIPLITLVGMHCVWIMDFILFEHTVLSSFQIRREGFGYYLIAGTLAIPFLYSVSTSYLFSRPDVGTLYNGDGSPNLCHCTTLGLSVALFLVGYWIYRISNNQKDLFCRQPNHPYFSEADKISGLHSQRLLVGGWWGFVRHPNYLGDIMMAFGMALCTGFVSAIPWIYPIFLTCFFCCRISRTERLSREKHGLGMDMYKKLVPSKLVPHVY